MLIQIVNHPVGRAHQSSSSSDCSRNHLKQFRMRLQREKNSENYVKIVNVAMNRIQLVNITTFLCPFLLVHNIENASFFKISQNFIDTSLQNKRSFI